MKKQERLFKKNLKRLHKEAERVLNEYKSPGIVSTYTQYKKEAEFLLEVGKREGFGHLIKLAKNS